MCAVTGQTGSSKSYSSIALMEYLNPDKTPEELIKNICTTTKQFMERINSNELKQGDVVVLDEAGVAMNSKGWASVMNRVINYILQTFRNMNLIVFFTLPHLSFLDSDSRKLLHSVIETKKIDRSEKSATLSPKVIQVNQHSGKIYRKYLRVRGRSDGLSPIKRIKVFLPSDKLLELYEAKKTEFTRNLNREILNKLNKEANKDKKEDDKLKAEELKIKELEQNILLKEQKINNKKGEIIYIKQDKTELKDQIVLTDSELTAWNYIKDGKTRPEVAKLMGISTKTASLFVNTARQKLTALNALEEYNKKYNKSQIIKDNL